MKNKLYYVLLVLLVSFSFVGNVFAFDFIITADTTNTEIVKGEEATVNVSLKSDSAIAGCLFKIESDNTVELISKTGLNGWNVSSEGTDGISVENSSLSNDSLSDGKNILMLKYKINGDGKVTVKTDHCVSTITEERNTFDDVMVNFTTKDISQDTTLSGLSISGAQGIEFSPTKYEYAAKLNNPNFSLTMTASNPDYQDDIVVTDGAGNVLDPSNITFSDASGQGIMIINITVNGDTEHVYSLALGYEQQELDNSLASLKINGQTIDLVEGKYEYSIKVGNDVNVINVEAILKDSENFEFYSEGNGPGKYNIGGSSTHIALMIVPKSAQTGGKSVTYQIEVIKEGGSGGTSNPPPSAPTGNFQNPQTGGISMFVMAFILISSLVGSIFLYQRNLESYK